MLDGNTPVAVSAVDNQHEETSASWATAGGNLEKSRGQVARRPWLAAGEGSVQARSYGVSAGLLRISARRRAGLSRPHFPRRREGDIP